MKNGSKNNSHRFTSSDMSDFDELFDMYKNSLIFFVNRITGNISISEDIAADAFAELIVNKPKYMKDKSSMKTFLYLIARSRAIDFIRREKKRGELYQIKAETATAAEDSLEDKVIKEEKFKILNHVLNELPQDYKTVLHLVYYEDMTYKEVSEIMNKSQKQIGNLMYRAKNALRNKIEKEDML